MSLKFVPLSTPLINRSGETDLSMTARHIFTGVRLANGSMSFYFNPVIVFILEAPPHYTA